MDYQGDKFGFLDTIMATVQKVEANQQDSMLAAASLMADAIENDRLINVYGGGGHTTLVMGEIFFRAGGLANINPIMETGLSVFNQSLKYLELERCVNYGRSIIRYYDLQPDDVLIIFHNIGINAATIDAALEAKAVGAKIIAVSSSFWQQGLAEDSPLRHPLKKNLFDLADVCIDDYNPMGDTVVEIPGLKAPMGPISNIVDFYIAHRLEFETAAECVRRGVEVPVWKSANEAGGDQYNKKYIDKYKPRVKNL